MAEKCWSEGGDRGVNNSCTGPRCLQKMGKNLRL